MAIDIVSKKASGAALGFVVIAIYIGAGIQDVVSGYIIRNGKTTIENISTFDFTIAKWFWIGAAVISVILALFV